MAIAQGNRNGPEDAGSVFDLLVGLITHVGGGGAHMKDRVKQQLNRTAAGADDEVRLTDGVGKALPRAAPNMLDADPEAHAQGQRNQGENRRKLAILQRSVGK